MSFVQNIHVSGSGACMPRRKGGRHIPLIILLYLEGFYPDFAIIPCLTCPCVDSRSKINVRKTFLYLYLQISVLYEFISATYNVMESDELLNVTVKRTGKPESSVSVGKIIIVSLVEVPSFIMYRILFRY